MKDFDPLLYMTRDQARRSDRFTQYALAAARQAMEESGLSGTIAPERLGVYVGSGIGGEIKMFSAAFRPLGNITVKTRLKKSYKAMQGVFAEIS